MKTIPRLMMVLTLSVTIALAQSVANSAGPERGFIDENHDGINDWFRDVNGDGINDIDRKTYRHTFRFQDQNRDGFNDLFVDEDGDGVNDLNAKFGDANKAGGSENIIDTDHNWINDITGEIYTRRNLGGSRYGFILEEYQEKLSDFTDQNGDGQDDRLARREGLQEQRMDRFIDADGDGVCDQRGFYRHRKGSGNRGSGRKP